MMTLAELAQEIPGSRLVSTRPLRFRHVSTDTRTIEAGSLYVALRGERFDGHDFSAQALEHGAVALMVERPLALEAPQLIVADTRRALGLAAARWRDRFSLPVIAVTGSNGKTTLTQMIAAVMEQAFGERAGRRNFLATRGNRNNEIGVPLTLFELAPGQRAAVLELGMNHPGEIAYLAQLVKPAVAVVNNAQREHQEFMLSVEATAHENGAAIAALPPEGVAVFPADDPCVGIWRQLAGTRRVLDFALHERAGVTVQFEPRADGSRLEIATPAGAIETSIGVAGEHNVHNALAATACCLAVGIAPAAIAAGLAAFRPLAGRGSRRAGAGGATLIDDTYNANPDSVRAAIDLLARQPAPRALLLGDMGEVGERGVEFHREIGAYARARGIDRLLATGVQAREAVAAFGPGGEHYEGVEQLIEAARRLQSGAQSGAESGAQSDAQSDVKPAATILVKGSRFMRMERAVKALAADQDA